MPSWSAADGAPTGAPADLGDGVGEFEGQADTFRRRADRYRL